MAILTRLASPADVTEDARRRRHVPSAVISVVTILAVLLVWFVVTGAGLVSETQLPSPGALVSRFGELVTDGYQGVSLLGQITASLFRTLAGFVIGAALGVMVGLLAGYSRVLAAMVTPIMAFVRPIPPIAFIPMVVLYFGLGETGKVVLITVTAFNYAVVNAQAGAAGTPIAFHRAAATLGLSNRQQFFKVILPSALPSIFTGLRVALALSWAVVVAAELVGAQKGLGYMINNAALLFDIPTVFIGVGLIGLIGLLLNGIIAVVEKRVVHWKGR